MEAKDTVMGNDVINPSKQGLTWATLITECLNEDMVNPPDIEEFLLDIIDDNKKAQAEISFKAGFSEGFKFGVHNLIASLNEGKEYGRKEVVEFVEAHLPKTLANYVGFWQMWEAQKEEWRIQDV